LRNDFFRAIQVIMPVPEHLYSGDAAALALRARFNPLEEVRSLPVRDGLSPRLTPRDLWESRRCHEMCERRDNGPC
jgi:hypothetical protein